MNGDMDENEERKECDARCAADLGVLKGLEQVEKAELYVLHFESQSAERGSRGHGVDTV